MTSRVAILGSGVCGLAIAIRLREIDPDLDISLFESEDRIGGLARSLTLGDQVADMGPHRIHTELPDVQAFLQDIAGGEMVRVERRSRMWLRGQWIDYPPNPFEILRVLGPGPIVAAMASFAAGTLGRLVGRDRGPDNFETVMTRAFGTELYRLIVLGYTRKVWKVDPRTLHADIARVRVSAGGLDRLVKRVLVGEKEGQETALRRFYYIPGGVERLVTVMHDRLAGACRIETRRRVADVRPTGEGHWAVTTDGPGGGRRTATFDRVFSTIPVTDLLDMLHAHRPAPAVAKARRDMRFIANFLVCVLVDRPRVSDSQWLYFPGRDTIFNRGYEPKNFHSTMGGDERSLLVLEITCHHGDAIWNAGDRVLVRRTLDGLERTGLVRRDEVLDTMVHRIPHTYPVYDLDYRRRLGRVWRYLAGFPGLLSVGRQGLFLHNNMDHSIHMGFRAAEVALREHPADPESHFYREVRRFQKFRIVD
jgi:protoporphyrinogen oxidase